MKILYVEDNSTDADLVKRYMTKNAPQVLVETLSSVKEAIACVSKPRAQYDVILTDLNLPDGDGLSLLNSIRDLGLPVAVVVVTGAGNEETAVAALKAGADDYLVKHNDYLDRLPLTLENALHGYRARAARQAHPLNVLYAERSQDDIDLTCEHFKHHAPHIHLDVVLTGPEALRRMRTPTSKTYDLILLDYRLPGMSALEVLKELRQDKLFDIPVLLVTGQGDAEVALQALKLGATSYVVKNPGYLHQLPGELENAHYRAELLRERAALRESEERFSKAFKANPQPMSLSTLVEGVFVDVNDSFVRMSGYARDEIIGRTCRELRIFEDHSLREPYLVQPLRQFGIVRNLELKFRTKSGPFRTLLCSAELIDLAGEQCILAASSDITERKVLEQELERSERQFSTLVENSPDVIARLDCDLRYVYVSPGLETATGVLPEDFIGKTAAEVPLKDYDWQAFETTCREAISTKQTVHRAAAYGEKYFWTRIVPELSRDGAVDSLMLISQDVTERLRAEEELNQLTAQMFRLQDEERRRISRELHDGTAQNLFGISVNLSKLNQLLPEKTEAAQLIEECESLGDRTLQEIRTLSYLLHPPLLDEAGLVSALQWYVQGFSKRSGIQVDLLAQPFERLPADHELALFRVVQESLTNVRRHSGSATASIRLERTSAEVLLEIHDDGHGLATKNSGGDSDSGELIQMGVGIPGMRQRLLQLGGRLEITSNNLGATVTAVLPVGNGATHVANHYR